MNISPHLASKPILPFPKGRNKLLCFVKDFSKSIQPMNISPHLTSKPILPFPKGRDKLLWRLISVNHISPLSFSPVGEKLVTIVNDKPLTI